MEELKNMKYTVTEKYILYICTCLVLSLGAVSADTVVFTKPDSADWTLEENQDRITDNVWITRTHVQSIFNIAQEEGYSGNNSSPVATLWADTTTAAAESASYTNFVAMHGGGPQSLIGHVVSMYLPQDGLYYDVTFLSYSGGNTGGGFSYSRTSIELGVDEPKIPTVFAVSGNYPNPFNPTTTFAYELPVTSPVELQLYDLNGRLVMDHNAGIKPPGKYTFVLDASSLASGLYTCVFSLGDILITRKIVLIK